MAEGTDSPYSKAAYVETPVIPDAWTLNEKTPAVQKIRAIYTEKRWPFTNWHLGLFYMFSNKDLAECLRDPEGARNCGNAAELFATLVSKGRVPANVKTVPPDSASAPQHESPEPSKAQHGDEANPGSRKRGFSVSSATGSLKRSVSDLTKRAKIFPDWKKHRSSGVDLDPSPSSNTKTEPPTPVAPTDKGKGRMTRSATAKEARLSQDVNESDNAQIGDRAGQEGYRGLWTAALTTTAPIDPTAKPPTRGRFDSALDGRDFTACIVTGKAKPYDRAHIVSWSINGVPGNLTYVPSVLAIAERLLGASFRQNVEAQLNGPAASDNAWNLLTLTPYLHELWDTHSLVGFKPCYIDTEVDKAGDLVFLATFSFHWLFHNQLDPKDVIPTQLTADTCVQMTSESYDHGKTKDRIFEVSCTLATQSDDMLPRVKDGQICRVRFINRNHAVKMMRMLEIRWTASRLLCLAGAAGEEYYNPDHGDDDDSEDNPQQAGYWQSSIWDFIDAA